MTVPTTLLLAATLLVFAAFALAVAEAVLDLHRRRKK
jgi:hypothetical protein